MLLDCSSAPVLECVHCLTTGNAVRYHGIPEIKPLRETEPTKLLLVRQVCTQGSASQMSAQTLQCVPVAGVGRKGVCLQVTFDIVNWEKMGPFHFLSSISLE